MTVNKAQTICDFSWTSSIVEAVEFTKKLGAEEKLWPPEGGELGEGAKGKEERRSVSPPPHDLFVLGLPG